MGNSIFSIGKCIICGKNAALKYYRCETCNKIDVQKDIISQLFGNFHERTGCHDTKSDGT